jgi:malate permease and related proteins
MLAVILALVKLGAIAVLGYILYKKEYIDERVLRFLTFFIISITLPFLIFSHLIENAELVLSRSVLFFLGLSGAMFMVGVLVSWGATFFRKIKYKREYISNVSFQNCGYLPMTMAYFMFSGKMRESFLIYNFLYLLGFNIILWSIGSFFLFRRKGEKFHFKSILTPPVIGTLIGLCFVYTRLSDFVPEMIIAPLRMIGDTTFVLSMIILGCWLAKIPFKGILSQWPLLMEVTALKLIAVPLVFIFIVSMSKLYSILELFIILEAAMPSAASLPIVVDMRDADTEFVSRGVLFTHIFSVITVPVWIGVFLHISGMSL